jgi:hypothetical protein
MAPGREGKKSGTAGGRREASPILTTFFETSPAIKRILGKGGRGGDRAPPSTVREGFVELRVRRAPESLN